MKGVIAVSQRDEPRMKRRASNTEGKNALTVAKLASNKHVAGWTIDLPSSSDRNRRHHRRGVAEAYPCLGQRELVEVAQGGKVCQLGRSCSVSDPS